MSVSQGLRPWRGWHCSPAQRSFGLSSGRPQGGHKNDGERQWQEMGWQDTGNGFKNGKRADWGQRWGINPSLSRAGTAGAALDPWTPWDSGSWGGVTFKVLPAQKKHSMNLLIPHTNLPKEPGNFCGTKTSESQAIHLQIPIYIHLQIYFYAPVNIYLHVNR